MMAPVDTETTTAPVEGKKHRVVYKSSPNNTSKAKSSVVKGHGRSRKNNASAHAEAKTVKPKSESLDKKKVTKPKESSRKRKREEETSASSGKKARVDKEKAPKSSKALKPARASRVSKVSKGARPPKKDPIINEAPTQRLHVFVCGEGSSGELGLGTAKNAVDVKRPRLNPFLSAETVGVVQVAVGGMHCAALTHDNRILTWGVNDQGALGRDTAWEGGLRDVDAGESDDSDESDSGLNPREATPTAIPSDSFPEGTKFVQLAAGDSSTFVLTDDGKVFGWGTFRSNEGILGFDAEDKVARTPTAIPTLKKVVRLACGDNHVLALTQSGNVFAWGSGQQNQLGRRVVERTRMNGLIPREFGLPRNSIKSVFTGAYHSFAVDAKDRVWAWGLNNYGETGIMDNAGEDEAAILKPTEVPALTALGVTGLAGGAHHSLAVSSDGRVYAWGRVDGFQAGVKLSSLTEEECVFDSHGKPRILKAPMAVPTIEGKALLVAAGSDHSLVVTETGKVYSWGFSAGYQTGLGTDSDVEIATLVENTAVKDKKLNWCGAGGQFSVLTCPAEVVVATNSD